VQGGRTRDSGHKLKQERLGLDVKKSCFMMETVKRGNRLSREVVHSSLEIFQTYSGKVLSKLI